MPLGLHMHNILIKHKDTNITINQKTIPDLKIVNLIKKHGIRPLNFHHYCATSHKQGYNNPDEE